MCMSLPACQELNLASGMPAPTPSPDSLGLTSPATPGASGATPPVLGFLLQAERPQAEDGGATSGPSFPFRNMSGGQDFNPSDLELW